MISNIQFWSSITFTPQQFEKKYKSDSIFWNKSGAKMHENMIARSKEIISTVELTDHEKQLNEFKK